MDTNLENSYWSSAVDEIEKSLGNEDLSENGPSSRLRLTANDVAQMIDHTLLKPEAANDQITTLCQEAKEYKFKTVCVRLNHVSHAFKQLEGSGVLVCCVIGFPEGTYSTEDKISESQKALEAGASELDVVINYPKLLQHDYATIAHELIELRAVGDDMSDTLPGITAGARPTLKLILETSQLDRQDIIAAVAMASKAEFDFVKTSTGFLGHGAKVEHVKLMKQVTRLEHKQKGAKLLMVKASGGIKTLEDAQHMVEAGADRLGVSAGVSIVKEALM